MNSADSPHHIPVDWNDHAANVAVVVAGAMAAARSAQARWACSPLAHRVRLVRELRVLIAENARSLAEASASARSRPMLEALTAEVLPLAEACRFLECAAEKVLAPRRLGRKGLPIWLAGVRRQVHREPFGVVLIVGPGNYPLLLPGVQLIQALVAGNAVVLKPGVGGTAAASALRDLVIRAGFDPDLVALLPESPDAARAALDACPDKVLFTGSAATGEKILARLASNVIPATMELSGCDAVLVRADADLELVTKAIRFALELNNGATCMSPKRVFVHRGIATELEGRLARLFHIGGSRGDQARPLMRGARSELTAAAVGKLRPLLDEALAGGAHFLAGEIDEDGSIIMPLVLAGVSPRAQLLREDVFAPVLAMVTVADDHEAVSRTNGCPFALAASIFTRDESVGRRLARDIDAGVVTINDIIIPTADPQLPFGGRKRSGFGVTRGAEGLLDLTQPKVVSTSRGRFRPAFEVPRPEDARLFQAYLKLAHGRGLRSRWTALVTLIRCIYRRQLNIRKELS
jgi:acyl-CoA reductase-like NAD-dependent aldehyde dehydrogenase